MFTTEQRDQIRGGLLDKARADSRICGAAITGSGSRGAEDRWSDVDLFFGVGDAIEVKAVLSDWSDHMYAALGALHHFDVPGRSAIYRVFLLPDCLQVDLAFTPAAEFGALGPNFRAVFGQPIKLAYNGTASADHLIGLAWHHVLHARNCIERRKPWEAEYWISAARDYTFALACLRLGLSASYAKGADELPAAVKTALEDALVHGLDSAELSRAIRVVGAALLRELKATNRELASKLARPLGELSGAQ